MDFIRSFRKLYWDKPAIYNWTRDSQNCDYGYIVVSSKDCYVCFDCGGLEDCMYCYNTSLTKSSADLTFCSECELCYECIDSTRCYNSNFLQDCTGCTDSEYCYDCQGCFDCFGCAGLRYKRNCIFNKQYAPEEYAKRLKAMQKLSPVEIEEQVMQLRLKHPHKYSHQVNTQNCTGDYIYNSKDCYHAFDVFNCEDCMYIDTATLELGSRDSVDVGPVANGVELSYDIAEGGILYNSTHCWWVTRNRDIHWCSRVWDCDHCFGCVYLQHRSYYFLNEPYEKEEYERLCAEAKKQLEKTKIQDFYGLIMQA